MSTPWQAERMVDSELACRLITAQFPALVPVVVEPFGAGWDNTAFLVNGRWVFRFPRREIAVPLLARETALLPLIAGHLPVAVPAPTYVGRPDEDYPWPFAGYPLIDGQTACRARLDAQAKIRLAEPLGRTLAALHAMPVADALALGAGPDELGRLDVATRVPMARKRLLAIADAGAVADPAPWLAILAAFAVDPADPEPRPRVLVHGDLYARHLLVSPAGELTGLIDWGDVHIGDPALDISLAVGFLPPAARTRFSEAYGPISAHTWRIARFRAVVHAAAVVSYALDTGDADLRREGLRALAHIVA